MNTPAAAYAAMMQTALFEAKTGLAEGGLPIGAALFGVPVEADQLSGATGVLLGAGHNRRIQDNDPSAHGETDAFRRAGRLRSYAHVTMVTTLAPCWYCSGLIYQFGFRKVIVGESRNFAGGMEWLRSLGIEVVDLDMPECISMMAAYIRRHPAIWNEDVGAQ